MYKPWISIRKEFYLLFNDKVGLSLMFLMPLLLVFVITIIQDSAFKVVNENKISLIIANNDKGELGKKLSEMLLTSGMFDVVEKEYTDPLQLQKEVTNGNTLTALYISTDFSEKIEMKSTQFSQMIMANLGLQESKQFKEINLPFIKFFNDPALQDNYVYSIISVVYTHLNVIEISQMLEGIYIEMGYAGIPPEVEEGIFKNRIQIERHVDGEAFKLPNSTQHNVPAWTIFAMFFMVISLGANIVKERSTGSFMRLKAMPTHFGLIMVSKQIVYVTVGVLQVLFIFSVGAFVFPYLNLPPLSMPSNILGIAAVVFVSAFAAVSYSLMLGSVARTQEQSNGFGAISIIIFAAIGGVWVPTFVMPEYMKVISQFSPLHWCIEAFYVLFLRGGDWTNLFKPLYILVIFALFCQIITFVKLKQDKLI